MEQNFIDILAEKIRRSSDIEPQLFEKYQVKRGLRNADESGVLVGLTNICEVVGFERKEGLIIPVEGRLIYRGIDINEITAGFLKDKRQGFEETIYLLFTGELPEWKKLDEFSTILACHRDLPMDFIKTNMIPNRGTDIMNMLARNVLFLYTFDKKAEDTTQTNLVEQSLSLIARFPVIVAYSYHGMMHASFRKTLYIRHPELRLSTAENFLYMLKGEENYTQLDADILDLCLVLHAEHGGGNNSSFTARVTSSTGTDTYSSMASAIASLKGPFHGGANLRVLDMMENIKENIKEWSNEKEVLAYLIKILKKEAHNRTGKIYGTGHAVYTISDPRTILLKQKARELAREKGKLEEFELYSLVEKLAPVAFQEFKGGNSKVLCANVDFYSGFVYACIGIPKEVFTPLFAIARVAGWAAHRLEELNFAARRVIRPSYKYVGPLNDYIPIDQR